MNNDKILAMLTNIAPDCCPRCNGRELYGGHATDFDVKIVICKDCGCIIYIKEDL